MLKLNVFGPYFGLPDASPFCIKALILLKMSGLDFEPVKMSFSKAPKGKAPYLDDGGTIIADSHFIMRHLERAHGADFSGGYSAEDLAKGWAVARMLEEHFYFLSMNVRWLEDDNFWKGPYQFFADAPCHPPPADCAHRSAARCARRSTCKAWGGIPPGSGSNWRSGILTRSRQCSDATAYILGDCVSASGCDRGSFPVDSRVPPFPQPDWRSHPQPPRAHGLYRNGCGTATFPVFRDETNS
jgi:hypothetical protein